MPEEKEEEELAPQQPAHADSDFSYDAVFGGPGGVEEGSDTDEEEETPAPPKKSKKVKKVERIPEQPQPPPCEFFLFLFVTFELTIISCSLSCPIRGF